MSEESFTDRISRQIDPKNSSSETIDAVLTQARSSIFSMGKLLDLPLSERRAIANEAQPIFDAIANSPDPGKESFVQFSEQNERLMSIDGSNAFELAKRNILTEVVHGIRVAIGPKSVELNPSK